MGTLYHVFSRFSLILLLFISLSFSLSAQRTIRGTVTDAATGEGLIGANVVVKGSTVGTVTDFDGTYTLNVPEGFDVLTFSYTGYTLMEVPLGSGEVVDMALDNSILDEVVLIGYGTVKRVDATGAVQTVSSKDFNKGAITGPQDLIAGKLAGVVVTSGGAPGDGATIRIRGESSIGASNDPLIVVDGVPIESGIINGGRNPLNVINPNDIETFTVLKDASAAAIYGNRATGGVILITTKKGNLNGGLKVGYNGFVSISNVSDLVDVLTGDEYRDLANNHHPDSLKLRPLLGTANTNWQEEIYQSAIGHDHNLSLSGGLAKIPFRVSLGYSDLDGVLKTDEFNRYTAGINLNPGFLDNTLQLNIHLKGMWTQNRFADRGAIGNAVNFDPTHTVRDTSAENPYGGFTTWELNGGLAPNAIAPVNPVALLELREDRSDEQRYISNVTIDYRLPFIPALRANLNLGYDFHKGEGEINVPGYASFAFDALNGGGVRNVYAQEKKNSILEFYLNYKSSVKKHSFDLMGGYSWQHFEVDDSFRNSDIAGTPLRIDQDTSNPREYYLVSFFGRANYGFNDRLLLTGTLRRDGTSRFAPDNRWGLFPSAALAYKLLDNDQENFNSLKLRAGWGLTGQQAVINEDYYVYLARYQLGNASAQYQFGDQFIQTIRANGYDSKIKWEETETYNLGLDFSIIRDRLSGTLDLYKRYTTDLINSVPVPAGTNLTNFITTNVGNMENKGVELSLNATPVSTPNVTWDISANVTLSSSEITKLRAIDDPDYVGVLTGGISGGVGSNIQIYTVGYAPKSFFVYQQLYDENGNILEGVFADRNEDGIVNEEDKYRFEKPSADMTFGFSNHVAVGNFDLSFAARASVGNYIYNNVQTDRGYLSRLYLSTGGETLWNVHQSAVDLNVSSQANLTFSDYYVQKANFLKMDHITMGYNFNELIGQFMRLSLTVQNVFTLSPYDGLDPEIYTGIDNTIYPRPRTIVFGLNLEF